MKIGYFNIIREQEKYVGGIMISDERGIPIEFKYTEPVTPTKIQKVLYGEVLEKYLREEIIITNLASKVENKPDIYITDDIKNFYLKDVVKEPVVVVKTTQLKPIKEAERFKFIKDNEAILQIEDDVAPLRVIIPEEYIPKKEEYIAKLLELGAKMQIAEPLTRIEEALKLVCKEEL